jgi:hypothetical protein
MNDQVTGELPVPVRVDEETGVWSVDTFPMILVPRHYWGGIMEAVEERLGVEACAEIYFDATYKSADVWCEQEAITHSLDGIDVLRHYLARMSARGWGQFSLDTIDPTSGEATISLHHSAIALHRGHSGRKECYCFNGAFCGAMNYISRSQGKTRTMRSQEAQCLADGADHCKFDLAPA